MDINIKIYKLFKKYDARIDGTKTVSFGERGASDFTKHKIQIEKTDT